MTNNLSVALTKMPLEFSSNKFIKLAKRHGLDQNDINNGIVASFLKKHCVQSSRRSWRKMLNSIVHDQLPLEITEDMCIKFLKATGKYKIQILTQTWTEI